MVRYIGKCGACKVTTARDYAETQRKMVGAGMYRREATIYGRTVHGWFVKASDDCECGACGAQRWNGKRVEGFTTGHKCDARCTEAKGFRCECSCGGKNHGQGFLICEPIAA
jgi:hypothetical protein